MELIGKVMIYLVFALYFIFIMTGCGTTKRFYQDCEKVENGYICED